jgi:hypothetical protein
MDMRSTWLDLCMDQVQSNAGLRLSFEYPHDHSVFFTGFVDLPFYDFFSSFLLFQTCLMKPNSDTDYVRGYYVYICLAFILL